MNTVKIGEVATPVDRRESPIPGNSYRQLGVKWWGEGAYERDTIDGSQTKYKFLSRVKEGDIIINKIWVRHGSTAVIQRDLVGCYGSSEFPLFEPDLEQLHPNWFHWLSKAKTFWSACDAKSQGTSGKNRIRPEQFLDIEIPLPPLQEQRRVVGRVEALVEKVEEARGLRAIADKQLKNFVSATHVHLASGRVVELGQVIELDEKRETITTANEYPQVGVRGFGGGLFAKESVLASETKYKYFNQLYEGAIVLSQVKGWEGAIASCPQNLANFYVSPEYRTFKCIRGESSPDYMTALVTTPWFWSRLKDLTRGMGGRRERTRPELFLKMQLPMPKIEQQAQAIESFKHLAAIKKLQAQTEAELNALIPAILDKAFKGEL